ncbi:TetR/AcrR family transcriptional regulator C-terminal domain-containing protein [Catenulispora sp. NF23]|uniref:TetR/AcrR family transcriptional regulator C-terminal domain-containing protein n=1 Tax=Catenulispora pinistramenti TaxID=2705254 RepID=A0ABS5KTX6_9ACTN|nr:TetR/AcrR family transcriptional regulator C-terminal domain-containing protein [Catenulispora pinistramenti]MBS2535088.1 TetR/AcrR family transcriptional regulator C-terminal domain-containing protein [Catenulispora pinistramenti]MBS2549503.1 TetR/AcrR family transcriptional regulator C-terminal domain-containing protein [Catenulispora pinistramenti]
MKLERQAIIDTAIALLDEVGLDKLSMRRLAKEFDVQAPALYWHFKNKQELLDHMLVAMSPAELRVPRPGQAWDDWLIERSRLQYGRLIKHRDGARLAAQTKPTEDLFPGLESMLEALGAAGFAPEEALRGLLAISSYITGSALEREGARSPAAEAAETPETAEPAGQPDGMPDMSQYPNLVAAVGAARDPDAVFDYGLNAIVAGMRAELEKRGK